MRTHRSREHLGRQGHAFAIDRANQHDRKLGEPGDLVEEAGVGLYLHPFFLREAVETGGDEVAALILVEDHRGGFELRDIILGVVDCNLARREKAMPVCRAADRHVAER